MKKTFYLLLTILIFSLTTNVYAGYAEGTDGAGGAGGSGCAPEPYELECVYGTGVVVTVTNGTCGLLANIKEYPSAQTITIEGDPISNISLFNCDGDCPNENLDRMVNFTCPNDISIWKILEGKEENGEWRTINKVIYSYRFFYGGDTSKTITGYYNQFKLSPWWWFDDEGLSITRVITLKSNTPIKKRRTDSPEEIIPLVAERLYVVGDLNESDYSFSYKNVSTEAIGSSKYIQLLKRTKNGTTTYFAKRGKNITSVSVSGSDLEEHMCFKEVREEQDTTRADYVIKYSDSRHRMKAATKQSDGSYTCSAGYELYQREEQVCRVDAVDKKPSFCDEYGNTAVVLIQIINIMQIVVPALVIILTGIEIGRIVVAGNVEEELPKRKKMITVRIIIMIVFLFLPVIVNLIINLLEDKTIYDVSCLFNNGVQYDPSGQDSNCIPIEDDAEGGE